MKQINDLNLSALASGLSKVLSEELGGEFDVTVQKLERTNPRFVDDKLLLSFVVDDVSRMERYSESKQGKRLSGGFFRESGSFPDQSEELTDSNVT